MNIINSIEHETIDPIVHLRGMDHIVIYRQTMLYSPFVVLYTQWSLLSVLFYQTSEFCPKVYYSGSLAPADFSGAVFTLALYFSGFFTV